MSEKKISHLGATTLFFDSPEEVDTSSATRPAQLYSYEDGPIDEYGDPLYLKEIRHTDNDGEHTITHLDHVTLVFGNEDNETASVSAHLFSYDRAPSDINGDALYLKEIIINE